MLPKSHRGDILAYPDDASEAAAKSGAESESSDEEDLQIKWRQITAAMAKALREKSGAGMMDCKSTHGDRRRYGRY